MVKMLGVNDEVTTCECCGKSNLKRTVVILFEDGDIKHYGVNCAAKALYKSGKNVSEKALNAEANALAYAQKWIGSAGAEKTGMAVWNKFGFSHEVKNGSLFIWLSTGKTEVSA